MYANNINGEIKTFSKLPTYWDGVNLYTRGFASSPNYILEEEGFYPIVSPQIDENTEELGDLYLENKKYYYIVIQK